MKESNLQQVMNGFVEAMYFADGAYEGFKDDEGYYLDGQFNNRYDLSKQALSNIKDLLETIIPKLPTVVFTLPFDRLGNIIYFCVACHGVSFDDELELCEDDKETIYQLFFNSVHLEIYDSEDTKQIEFTYTENWN